MKWQNCSDILETKHGAMLKHGVMLITWSFADSVLLCVSHIKLSVYFVGSQTYHFYRQVSWVIVPTKAMITASYRLVLLYCI